MADNSIVIAGALIAGAILFNGYVVKSGERYQLSAAGTGGQTVWRLDTRNGRLSMCGSIIDGAAFSQVEARQTSAVLNEVQNPSEDAKAKILQDTQQTGALYATHCTDWTDD